jgi:hypothetical protein
MSQIEARLLAIGSRMDEIWQILHYLRESPNPLNKTNFFAFLYLSLRDKVALMREISRIDGAKSLQDLGLVGKLIAGCFHLLFHLWVIVVFGMMVYWLKTSTSPMIAISMSIVLIALLPITYYMSRPLCGDTFRSAFLSPYRRYARLVRSLSLRSVGIAIVTYIMRRRGWSVLQAMAMGLAGYGYQVPTIEQCPSYVPRNFVKYEDMPRDAEQRALARRNAWMSRHLGGVAQTFSKMVVTPADLASLQREVEADPSLVHAAYYTDDECIARIADWIAGRNDLPPHRQLMCQES